MHKSQVDATWGRAIGLALVVSLLAMSGSLFAQGVTTGSMSGLVSDSKGAALSGANVVAVHEPSGTKYGTAVRAGGAFNIPNMKIGGPYTVTASFVGHTTQKQENVFVSLGQDVRLSFKLAEEAIVLEGVQVTAEQDEVLNSDRTGAATYIKSAQVLQLPSIKRSTRDLTRLDPRSDGNFSFGGKNWLYNNISLDGSYFNNPFGLDDPAPGGQTSAEPVPYDAVEQVQVSVAPFDVREGGFTGAGINTVTKSGTNQFKGSAYSFLRNEDLLGNEVSGKQVVARPDLKFNQSGATFSGPLIHDKLFFFLNGELERRDDPGSNFVVDDGDGVSELGESRVRADSLKLISQALINNYGYDPGPYQGFIHETNSNKLLLKLDWNINQNHNLTFRYNLLDAERDLPPHPFVLSFNNTNRGPNESSLPFRNSGYRINNDLNSYALEINSRSNKLANRFFASYNRFRDFRAPFSKPFPTIEIGSNGVQYTTVGHEPFSIQNILDQDVLQFTNNLSLFSGKHVYTVGANFETFSFFNSFNLFKYGSILGFLPTSVGNPVFASVADFLKHANRNDPANFFDYNAAVAAAMRVPFKGEDIDVGQLAFYVQDEYLASEKLNLTYGLRVDLPMYFNDVVDNAYSRGLTALDENGNSEIVDQSKLPDTKLLFSPRIGFNWSASGDRSTQVRGGTGIFTGRVPFVWVGNNISNPGQNTKLPAHLQSFDLNAMDPDFKWPQVWTTNLAIDKTLPWNMLGTLEFIYGRDINGVFVRNADLRPPVRVLPDGRPYYGGAGNNELNADFGAGIYVIDNINDGYNFAATMQLRKNFTSGLNTSLAYTFTRAKNQLKSTEIASVLWQNQPVQGNPNKPELSFSEFGHRHRVVGGATYSKRWSNSLATHFGLFLEVAEGNRFAGSGGNRYSYIYSGDVNGDGQGGNDLIYIPRNATNTAEIAFADIVRNNAIVKTAQQQAQEFEAFIGQDEYLSSHRGQIAQRFGGVNPWYSNIDLRILQDFSVNSGSQKHTFQLNVDILNVANLLDSGWGVRKVANVAATSPLQFVGFDTNPANNIADGAPVFNFSYTGQEPLKTFSNDLNSLASRWQIQVGLKYFFD